MLKYYVFLLFAFVTDASSEESKVDNYTHLTCTGTHIYTVTRSDPNFGNKSSTKTGSINHQIKFDEAKGEFFMAGHDRLHEKSKVGDWYKARKVTFLETHIDAEFRLQFKKNFSAKNILSKNISYKRNLVARLDRYSGTWSSDNFSVPCVRQSERLF